MSRVVFTHANMLDGENPAKADTTVIVEGNRIVQIVEGGTSSNGSGNGSSAYGPEDRVIDCTGLTLMPGMTQGHYHSTYNDVTPEMALPLGYESAPAYQAYVAMMNANRALRAGYTSVVGANAAWDVEPSLKQAIEDGVCTGPRVVPGCKELITTADSNDVTPWYWRATGDGGTVKCDGPDEFRKAVREEVKRGAEVIKLFVTGGHGVRLSRYTSSITDAELHAAADAAHNLEVKVRAHVCSYEGVKRCLDAGVDIIDHGEGIDDELIERMAEQKVSYEPSVYSHFVVAPLMGDTDFTGEFGTIMRDTCAVLPKCAEAGVNVVFGDDFGASILPHGSYGKEPVFYHEWTGLSTIEIIKWGTANGGRLVGLPDLGQIREGWLADLILINGDPSQDLGLLADIDNVVTVMRDGQIYHDYRDKIPAKDRPEAAAV
jgi:imidazolonepropionase-like amidohydrolase